MSFRIERLTEVESTMDAVHARARDGAAEGLWILAERQTKGRGRRGRSWLSTKGALATTLLLRPATRRADIGAAETASLSFIAALALRDALLALRTRSEIRLKWPNDVLVAGGKIAGILLESDGAGAAAHLALGVGLNLQLAPEQRSLEQDALRPTALAEHGVETDADQALAALSSAFEIRYERWIETGFAGQRVEWLEAAAGLGAPIVARMGEKTIEGRFADVDVAGALIVETAEGPQRVLAADVFLPAGGEG